MKETKHTPGPWKVNGHPGNNAGTDWRQVTDCKENPVFIAECHKNNARLIAAAPEMLEALERLLVAPDLNWDHMEQESIDAMEQARAAIAKAKGTQ